MSVQSPVEMTAAIHTTIEQVAAKKLFSKEPIQESAVSQLTSFITHFSDLYRNHPRDSILRSEGTRVVRKWTAFQQLSSSIPYNLSSLKVSDINDLFLGEGLCTATVVYYFSQFFRGLSPCESAPLPVSPEPLKESSISFYPIQTPNHEMGEKTKQLRFLHAAYLVESSAKTVDSFEYVPKKLLTQHHLESVGRLPDLRTSEDPAYPIEDLFKILKNLEKHAKTETGYLLGLGGPENHHMALCLQGPYHFFDQRYGLAVSENKEEFLLFLGNYLNEKYPTYKSFALLEFSSNHNPSTSNSAHSKMI